MVFDVKCERMLKETNGMSEFTGRMQEQGNITLYGRISVISLRIIHKLQLSINLYDHEFAIVKFKSKKVDFNCKRSSSFLIYVNKI